MLESLTFEPEGLIRAILIAQAERLLKYAEYAYNPFEKHPRFGGVCGSNEIHISLVSNEGEQVGINLYLTTDPFESVPVGKPVKNLANPHREGIPLFLQTGWKQFSWFNEPEDLLNVLSHFHWGSDYPTYYSAVYESGAIRFVQVELEDVEPPEPELIYDGTSIRPTL